jgi:peptidoglycan/xylan/chitin deacetylase (PgdA/CDA1 family)
MDTSELRLEVRTVVAGMKHRPEGVAILETELSRLLPSESDRASGIDRFMSWEQTAQLTQQSDTSIGAHGCSHTPLTLLPEDRLAHELRECRDRIAAATGESVVAVAYPNGDFSDLVVQEARRAGYRLGFTTRRGHVSMADDRFKLRRINIHESATATMPEFLCTLLGVFRRYQLADGDARSRHGR